MGGRVLAGRVSFASVGTWIDVILSSRPSNPVNRGLIR